MKRELEALLLPFMLAFMSQTNGQNRGPKPFDPRKFEIELEQFIATETCLTPQESAAFFPLYREMRKKQMAYFVDDLRFTHLDITNDKACEEAIRNRDSNEIRMKEIQQTYHDKFLRILPAGRVFSIIKAEEKFHRQLMKRIAGQRNRNLKVHK